MAGKGGARRGDEGARAGARGEGAAGSGRAGAQSAAGGACTTDKPAAPRTGAGEAAGGGLRGSGGLTWVRVRLRTAPGAALALCLLVLATAFLAAALPRAVDRYQDDAVHQALRQAPPRERGVSLVDTYQPMTSDDDSLLPGAVDQVEETFSKQVRPPLRLLRSQAVYGVRTGAEADVADPGLAHTSDHVPAAVLVAQAGYGSRVRVVSGRLPHAPPAETGNVDDTTAPADGSAAQADGTGGTGGSVTTVEGVVTEQTARTLHLKVGRTIHLSKIAARPLPVRVTGIVAPRDPAAPWWNEDTDLLRPQLGSPPTPPGETPKTYWHFTVLVDRDATASFPLLGVGADLYWHHPLDIDRLAAHEVPALQRELSSFESGPDAAALQSGSEGVHMSDSAGSVLDAFTADRAAASPLVLIAAVGVGATAAAVLLMAGGLAADRRRAEIALLRSRGGSLRGIGLRLAGETAAAAVPGGAAGTLLALALLRTDRWTTAVALGAAATAVGVVALPLRAVWAVRRPQPAGGRDDLAVARPSRRRLVVELTTAVVVVGAVVALRQRGAGDGNDPYLAAAPVLVAVAAALVLLRLYPLPLRLLARPAARLRGAVAHLGLARAGRSPATAGLPLLALMIALTVASFGGSVLAGVDRGRDRAAAATVGADARIDARFALSPRLAGAVRKVPGVGQVVTARVERSGPAQPFAVGYSVIVVDPAPYAALTRAAGLPDFPASAYADWAPGHPLPAVVSPALATTLRAGPESITTGVGTVPVAAAATLPTTAAAPGADFVVLSRTQLDSLHPDLAAYPQNTDPTTLLAMDAPGRHIDGRALHATAARSTAFATVLLRAEQRAALSDSPLQHGARRIYLAAVAAGAGFSVLALLLSLLQAAPQRSALLARLRTMGMGRAQAQRLVLLEMLPQVLLAAVGGVLVGLALIPLLGPGVDLRALTFGTGQQGLAPVDFGLGLRADPWSLALPSAGLLVVACAVLLAQAWLSSRRRESTELRAGDAAA